LERAGHLGNCDSTISEASYQHQLSQGLFAPRVYRNDDDAAHDEEPESLWSQELKFAAVFSDGKFPNTTSFRLRKAEATFLESRYAALKPDRNETLVTGWCCSGIGMAQGVSVTLNPPVLPVYLVSLFGA